MPRRRWVVSSLKADLPPALDALRERLVFELIAVDDTSRETEHSSLEQRLDELLQAHSPELCIHVGQVPPNSKITIEKIGINTFMHKIIDPERPPAYWSDLPGIDSLKAALEDQHIPADYSFYAGQHLCNHILFSGRHFAETRGLEYRTGFIHIPVLPEQVAKQHHNTPSMPVEMVREALAVIINRVVASNR